MLLDVLEEERILPAFKPDLEYLRILVCSREADKREGILFRQGQGFFCLPSAGHENMAAIAYALTPKDYIYCHYRDRALMLARGMNLKDMALGYFAKKDSSSIGRQLSSHFSCPEHHIVSLASPTGSQCIPATGTAWACKMAGEKSVVVCCIGEASIRQGEFYEAVCFSIQEKLPIVFIVEDNAYGISTPTEAMNPLRLGILEKDRIVKVDGRTPEPVFEAMRAAVIQARTGNGPSILWIRFDRLMSHTSSDDQRSYRLESELAECKKRDPIYLLRNSLFDEGIL